MANKLIQNETNSCSCTENTSMPENKSSYARHAVEAVPARFQNAPVPLKFKRSLQGVISDPRSSSFSSMNPLDAGDGFRPRHKIPEMTMDPEPIGSMATPGKAAQSLYLTETVVNLAGLEYSTTPGLQRFDGQPLSALVTNTYFLEPCFCSPIYWCPGPTDPPKAISAECIALWNEALKTIEKNGVLTADEYTALIKKCPDFAILFYRIVEDNTFKPKTKNLLNIGAFKKWKKKADEEAKKKQKESDDAIKKDQAAYDKSHNGKGHSPCECWNLTAYAQYKDGTKIQITGKTADNPTKIPKLDLTFVAGKGNEAKGPHQFKPCLHCCSFEYLSKYVQVAHTLPKGKGVQPKYTGPTHGMDRSHAIAEYAYWITLTSTPNNYGWDFANGIGKYRCDKKRESVVQQVFGDLTLLKSGLGKIEMNINGKNCPSKTLWYEVS